MPMSTLCRTDVETGVRLESEIDAAVAVMTVHGPWDRWLSETTTVAVHRCLDDHPEALIIDLTALDDPRTESTPTWIATRRRAAELSPAPHIALCVPPDLPLADRMQMRHARPHLPVYAKLRQARVAVAGRLPETERFSARLLPEPESPSLARDLVSRACAAWGRTELLHAARLVMSELVTNAVEHARTPMTVVVTRRGAGLHVSVSDELADPPAVIRMARPRRARPLDERGRGLLLVSATAAAWGWLPTRTGKVVWALIGPR